MTKTNTAKIDATKDKKNKGAIIGAAFIMATSAVGPGFLTQTAVFTEKFNSNFAFAILMVTIATIIVQLNIWRVICVSGMRGQDIANKVFPGLGYFVAFLVALGGLAFNIGNIGGAALGLNVLFGMNTTVGVLLAGALGAFVFLQKDMGNIMDRLTKVLGAMMIVVMTYVAISSNPPVGRALHDAILPESYGALSFSVITLLGGTIGGYITFAGAHRLVDANTKGIENLDKINQSSILGVSVAAIIRVMLFLAVLGVVSTGFKLDPSNPPASAFRAGAGIVGYKIFGLVIFSAALTSIVGAAYTSVSFLKTLSKTVMENENKFIIGFIAFSTVVMAFIGKPVVLLILAGSLNGLILPLTLGIVLLGSRKEEIVGKYKHSKLLTVLGWIVVVASGYAGMLSLQNIMKIFN